MPFVFDLDSLPARCAGHKAAWQARSADELKKNAPFTYKNLLASITIASYLRAISGPQLRVVYEMPAKGVPLAFVDVIVRALGPVNARYVTRMCASSMSPMRQDRYFFSSHFIGRPVPTLPTPTPEQWLHGINTNMAKFPCFLSGAARSFVLEPGYEREANNMKTARSWGRHRGYGIVTDAVDGAARTLSLAELEVLKCVPVGMVSGEAIVCDNAEKIAQCLLARALCGFLVGHILVGLGFEKG